MIYHHKIYEKKSKKKLLNTKTVRRLKGKCSFTSKKTLDDFSEENFNTEKPRVNIVSK